MQKRFEYKYLVPDDQLDGIRREILPFVKLDLFADIMPEKQYTVRSIYYDTGRLSSYFEKIEGVAIRRKFRIRGYNERCENSRVFLEIKNKFYNNIGKNRASLPYCQLKDYLLSTEFNYYEEELLKDNYDAQKFLFHFHNHDLQPVVLIVYDREAFQGKFDSALRITFDKNVRSSLFPGLDELYRNDKLKPAIPGNHILECKFYTIVPRWFRYIVNKYNLPRQALSKYTMCLDSHIIKPGKYFDRMNAHSANLIKLSSLRRMF